MTALPALTAAAASAAGVDANGRGSGGASPLSRPTRWL
jgi:hypothetical protein